MKNTTVTIILEQPLKKALKTITSKKGITMKTYIVSLLNKDKEFLKEWEQVTSALPIADNMQFEDNNN